MLERGRGGGGGGGGGGGEGGGWGVRVGKRGVKVSGVRVSLS